MRRNVIIATQFRRYHALATQGACVKTMVHHTSSSNSRDDPGNPFHSHSSCVPDAYIRTLDQV